VIPLHENSKHYASSLSMTSDDFTRNFHLVGNLIPIFA